MCNIIGLYVCNMAIINGLVLKGNSLSWKGNNRVVEEYNYKYKYRVGVGVVDMPASPKLCVSDYPVFNHTKPVSIITKLHLSLLLLLKTTSERSKTNMKYTLITKLIVSYSHFIEQLHDYMQALAISKPLILLRFS